jgi:hypothetical protein
MRRSLLVKSTEFVGGQPTVQIPRHLSASGVAHLIRPGKADRMRSGCAFRACQERFSGNRGSVKRGEKL